MYINVQYKVCYSTALQYFIRNQKVIRAASAWASLHTVLLHVQTHFDFQIGRAVVLKCNEGDQDEE
jgi:uncharacterized protein YbgA (DUF1722 family)